MNEMTPEEFFGIVNSQPKIEFKKPEYRLYYDENGYPLFFSSEDRPGNYVVVDRETYLHSPGHIRVVDGKLKFFRLTFGKKLRPASTGQACDTRDICVVVAEDQPHTKWTLKHQDPEHD
jgi:hypothetical protein